MLDSHYVTNFYVRFFVCLFYSDDVDFDVVGSELFAATCINLNNPKYSVGEANFMIIASDPGFAGDDVQEPVKVIIKDVNDNKPVFTNANFTVYVDLEDLVPNNVLFHATAEDEDKVHVCL